MAVNEQALVFDCEGDPLVGVLSGPDRPASRGVMIIVGGPQYRAGSHRQFTLLARALAQQGIAAMRFDCRGMGDSTGEPRSFEDVEPDIRAAIDHFRTRVPAVKEVVLWGLCDAASAALFYAHRDPRVTGLVLLNPWVRTSQGIAKAYLKHYYWSRMVDAELWRKIGRGEFEYATAAKSLVSLAGMALGLKKHDDAAVNRSVTAGDAVAPADRPLPERMADGLERFRGKVLLILSGKDLTAQEFNEVARASRRWGKLLSAPRVERRDLSEADHTFSRREWRDQVAAWTADWVRSW